MQRITVGRYKNPAKFIGWIDGGSWIVFVTDSGELHVGTNREGNGAVGKMTIV